MNGSNTTTTTTTTTISRTTITTPATKPAAPINVAESRGKRLERQQARFRDRGGIFVPFQRDTLLNILLGKTTLGKYHDRRSRSRSASLSPIRKGKEKTTEQQESTVSKGRKPRKSRKKSFVGEAEDDQPVAGPSRVDSLSEKKAPQTRRTKKAVSVKAQPKPRGRKPAQKTLIADSEAVDLSDTDLHIGATNSRRRSSRITTTASALSKRPRPTTSVSDDEAESDYDSSRKPAVKKRKVGVSSARDTVPKKGGRAPAVKRKGQAKNSLGGLSKEDDEPVIPSRTAKGKSKAADVSTLPASSKAKTRESARSATSQAKVTKKTTGTRRGTAKTTKDEGGSASDDDDGLQITPVRRKRAVATKKNYAELSDDESEPDDGHRQKEKQPKTTSVPTLSTSEDTKGKGKTKKALTPVPEESEPESEKTFFGRNAAQKAMASARKKSLTRPGSSSKPTVVSIKGWEGIIGQDSEVDGDNGREEKQEAPSKSSKSVSSSAKGKKRTGTKIVESTDVKTTEDKSKDERILRNRKTKTDVPVAPVKPRKRTSDALSDTVETAPVGGIRKKAKVASDVVEGVEQVQQERPKVRSRRKAAEDVSTSLSAAPPEPSTSKVKKRSREDVDGAEDEMQLVADGDGKSDHVHSSGTSNVVRDPDVQERQPKRAKVVDSSESTLDQKSRSKQKLKTSSRIQKENSSVKSKATTTASASASAAAKSPPKASSSSKSSKTKSKKPRTQTKVSSSKGPPKSVLDRIKRSAALSSNADEEPDEIDFLS